MHSRMRSSPIPRPRAEAIASGARRPQLPPELCRQPAFAKLVDQPLARRGTSQLDHLDVESLGARQHGGRSVAADGDSLDRRAAVRRCPPPHLRGRPAALGGLPSFPFAVDRGVRKDGWETRGGRPVPRCARPVPSPIAMSGGCNCDGVFAIAVTFLVSAGNGRARSERSSMLRRGLHADRRGPCHRRRHCPALRPRGRLGCSRPELRRAHTTSDAF
jgi:hypothetical protein